MIALLLAAQMVTTAWPRPPAAAAAVPARLKWRPLVRASMCLALCLLASPGFAQSTYVGGSIGANTPLLSRYEVDRQPQIDAGTAVAIGARAGLALGARWGAELDFSHGFEVATQDRSRRGSFGPGVYVLYAGNVNAGTNDQYELITEVRQRSTTLSPVMWFSHTVTNRIDLVLVAGAGFDRMVADERYELVLPPRSLAVGVVSPSHVHIVQYHVGVLAGLETRLAVGEHLRLIPGVRMQGLSGGWAIRPAFTMGWFF